MKKLSQMMEYSKSTPGTHVYKAVDKEPAVPSLYIRKNHLPTTTPDSILIEIHIQEPSDEE